MIPYTVPNLEIDKLMAERYGHTLSLRHKLERRIVAALCAHMASKGWSPMSVWNGEDLTPTPDVQSAMELIFNLDEAWLHFHKDEKTHGVFIVLGNGEDLISDWRYSTGDPDGFNAAMNAFDVNDVL